MGHLQRQSKLMKYLRGTLISTGTAERLFLLPTAQLTKVLFLPSKARDSVDLVLPLPQPMLLRPVTERSLECLETTQSSKWLIVDMAREDLAAMEPTPMLMPSGLVIEQRVLPVRNSTHTRTPNPAWCAEIPFPSLTRELVCLAHTTRTEEMKSL